MSKMIQIRNVPDDLHRVLKIRAIEAGMSLSDYLLAMARDAAERPSLEQLRARLATRSPVNTSISAVDILRQARDSG